MMSENRVIFGFPKSNRSNSFIPPIFWPFFVAPFVCSILNKKPIKYYSMEPSKPKTRVSGTPDPSIYNNPFFVDYECQIICS